MATAPRIGGLLTLGIALMCSGAATAQIAPTMPGAPGGTERVSGDVRAQATYSSNVAGGDSAVAALRGVTPEDISYAWGATVNLQLPSSRYSVFLSGNADVLRHDRNSVLDAVNYSVAGGGAGRVGPCNGSAIVTYNSNETPPTDLTIAVSKNTAAQDAVNVSATCGRRGFYMGLQGGYMSATNSASNAGFVDSHTGNVAASLGYQNNTFGNVSLSAQYSKTGYENNAVLLAGRPDGFEQYGVQIVVVVRVRSYRRIVKRKIAGHIRSPVQSKLSAHRFLTTTVQ